MRRFAWADYFPSYEIITGSYAGGLYYEADGREVNRLGVAHAMRCFVRNYVGGPPAAAVAAAPLPVTAEIVRPVGDIVCDEEVLSGLRF